MSAIRTIMGATCRKTIRGTLSQAALNPQQGTFFKRLRIFQQCSFEGMFCAAADDICHFQAMTISTVPNRFPTL
jgi:hypothetical protein